jgi:hypothetical protein
VRQDTTAPTRHFLRNVGTKPEGGGGSTIFQKSGIYLKILGARKVRWSKFHAEDPQIPGATVKKICGQGVLAPGIVRPLVRGVQRRISFFP